MGLDDGIPDGSIVHKEDSREKESKKSTKKVENNCTCGDSRDIHCVNHGG
jgi:hypothetical protein